MAEEKDLTGLFSSLDEILSNTNLDKLNDDFQELPDGYYLSEVTKADLTTSKSSGKLQVAMSLSIVENGTQIVTDEEGNATYSEVPHSKNRKIFLYFGLDGEDKVKRFVRDMLKFEGEDGQPLLSKEYFKNHDLLVAALDALVGSRIYISVSTSTNKEGQQSTWKNIIGWDRVKALELPM